MKLHRADAVAHLEGEPCIHVEGDMGGHLADDAGEFSGRHLIRRIIDIPELDEYLGPGLGIGAAVESGELSRLHLGHMIAAPYCLAVISKRQAAGWTCRQAVE